MRALWSVTLVACAPSALHEVGGTVPPAAAFFECRGLVVTPGGLSAKSAALDLKAQALHVPAGQNLIHAAWLDASLSAVERYDVADNTGLWTAAYSASQAFRWAATRDPAALANLRRSLEGERQLMEITGVPGLFARAYVAAGVPGFQSPEELFAQGGCELASGRCGSWRVVAGGPYAGWMWKGDVSKDEYSGHMFALSVIAELVDEPDVQATVRALLADVSGHLVAHDLDHPMTNVIVPLMQRVSNYPWTRNPYRIPTSGDEPRRVVSPEGYLLAYWLGRWAGLVDPAW